MDRNALHSRTDWEDIMTAMDAIAHALEALVASPTAPMMGVIALLCAVNAARSEVDVFGRLGMSALALISAVSAWMVATYGRWPS
jgi:hypothetical protein